MFWMSLRLRVLFFWLKFFDCLILMLCVCACFLNLLVVLMNFVFDVDLSLIILCLIFCCCSLFTTCVLNVSWMFFEKGHCLLSK